MIKRIVNEIRKRPPYKWHRHIGTLAAVFFVFLAVTGVAINHADALKLDQRHLASDWLLDWYGIEPETDSVSFATAGGHWLTGTRASVYLDARRVATTTEMPVGIAETNGVLAVATGNEILLLTPDGDLIERIAGNFIPGPIEKLGITAKGQAIAKTPTGMFLADRNLLTWKPSQATAIWSQATAAPAQLLEGVGKAERRRMLNLERVLLDLHSGRLFGRLGPYLMDGVALLLLALVGTGFYMRFLKRGQ
ncbi:MAG: hypothetical protein COA65_10030 [Rhodospirillaceae bacterium]|nr:MAG: hypothetical protein COA65_10030 [Rhodospirillaceae bacterium]